MPFKGLKAYVQKVQIGELNMTWLVSWFSHEYFEYM